MASAKLFTLLNNDDEGEDAAPFGRDASASLGASSWRAPNAPGTSRFEAIDLGSNASDDGVLPGTSPKSSELAEGGKGGIESIASQNSSCSASSGHSSPDIPSPKLPHDYEEASAGADDVDFVGAVAGAWAVGDLNGVSLKGSDTETEGDSTGLNSNESFQNSSKGATSIDVSHVSSSPTPHTDQVASSESSGSDVRDDSQEVKKLECPPLKWTADVQEEEDMSGTSEAKHNGNGTVTLKDDSAHGASGDSKFNGGAEGGVALHTGAPGHEHESAAVCTAAVAESLPSASTVNIQTADSSEVKNPPAVAPAAAGSTAAKNVLASPERQNSASSVGGSVTFGSVGAESATAEATKAGNSEVPGSAKGSGTGSEPISVDDDVVSVEMNAAGGDAPVKATVPVETMDAEQHSLELFMESLPPGFVRCPGCPMVYELVPNEDAARGGGGGVSTQELPKGSNLSRRAAMRHSGRHRFRCPSCSATFCDTCRCLPYHFGFSCESWVAYQARPKCVYCGDAAQEAEGPEGKVEGSDESGVSSGEQEEGLAPPCCGSEECQQRANESCRKKLSCGHPCRGPGAEECLPCMEPGCPSAAIDGDAEFCNVCWTESLLAAPCVKLECGHFVHAACGRELLQKGRPTARLTFGFMSCPVCRADKALAKNGVLGKTEGIAEQLVLATEVEGVVDIISRLQSRQTWWADLLEDCSERLEVASSIFAAGDDQYSEIRQHLEKWNLALQRLRADELPPLQRSPMGSLQAKMQRRWAGLARYRQLDGAQPGNWRRGGYGVPMPYPPFAGYHLPRRVRGYPGAPMADVLGGPGQEVPHGPGAAYAPVAPHGPGGGPVPGQAPPDWHPFGVIGPDWGMPLLPPPPYPPRGLEGVAGGAGSGAQRGAHGGMGGGGGEQPPAALKREMLIARAGQARVMVRHNAIADLRLGRVGRGRPPRDEPGAAGIAGDGGAAGLLDRGGGAKGVNASTNEDLKQKKPAMAETRNLGRRDARQELEDLVMMEGDWPLPDGFPHRSRPSRRLPNFPDPGGAAGGEIESSGGREAARGDRGSQHGGLRDDLGDDGERSRERERRCDAGSALGMPDLYARDPWVPDELRPPQNFARPSADRMSRENGRRRQRIIVEDLGESEDEDGQSKKKAGEGEDANGEGEKGLFGVWGWGGAGRWWNGRGAQGAGEAGRSQESKDNVYRDGAALSRRRSFSAVLAASSRHAEAKKEAKASGEEMEVGGSANESDPIAGAAIPSEDASNAAGRVDRNSSSSSGGDASNGWIDVLPWPLRPAKTKLNPPQGKGDYGVPQQKAVKNESSGPAASGMASTARGAESDEDVIIVDEEEERRLDAALRPRAASAASNHDGAISAPIAKRRKTKQSPGNDSPHAEGMLAQEVLVQGEHMAEHVSSKDSETSVDVQRDESPAVPAADAAVNDRNAPGRSALEGLADIIANVEQRAPIPARSPQPHHVAPGHLGPNPSAAALPPQFPGRQPFVNGVGAAAPAHPSIFDGAPIFRAHDPLVERRPRRRQYSPEHHSESDRRARGRMAAEGMMKLRAERRMLRARERANALRVLDAQVAAAAAAAVAVPPPDAASGASSCAGADHKKGGGGDGNEDDEAKGPPPLSSLSKEQREEMVQRALKKYSFYQCHSCRKPYFGGLVSCEPAAPGGEGAAGAGAGAGGGVAAEEAQAAERSLANVKPQELLCGKCSAGSGGADCSEHGQEFMEHKCYWCCRKVSSYFCGGVMHFCDVCHLHGFAAKPKPCLGGSRCLFGGAHPPNARNGLDEFVLGCGICRPKPEDESAAPALGNPS